MNNPIKIAALITTFNREALVLRAIQSVLAQTYPVSEIIVVDDASSDNTEAVINRLGCSLIRYFKIPENVGQPVATNIGLDLVTADLIAFLDSDDIWLPDKLEKQVRYYTRTSDPERLAVSSRLRISGGGLPDRIRPHRVLESGTGVGRFLFTNDGVLQTSTLLVPSAIARTVRFHPEHRVHTDIGFSLRLEEEGVKFEMVPDVLSIWTEDNPEGRSSFHSKYDLQLNWLASFGHLLSPNELKGFRARLLFPYTAKLSLWTAITDTYSAWRSRSVSAKFMLSNFLRLGCSGKRYWQLRTAVTRLRHPLTKRPLA